MQVWPVTHRHCTSQKYCCKRYYTASQPARMRYIIYVHLLRPCLPRLILSLLRLTAIKYAYKHFVSSWIQDFWKGSQIWQCVRFGMGLTTWLPCSILLAQFTSYFNLKCGSDSIDSYLIRNRMFQSYKNVIEYLEHAAFAGNGGRQLVGQIEIDLSGARSLWICPLPTSISQLQGMLYTSQQ